LPQALRRIGSLPAPRLRTVFVACVCCCFVASGVSVLCHSAGCLVLLTAQLFRDSCSGLPWRPQAPPPSRPPLRASLAHFAQVPLAPRLSVWVSPHFALLFSAVVPGLFWVACLGGVVPGALLRSSSPALSGMRYGLEGSSANRVWGSPHLLYSVLVHYPRVLATRPLFIWVGRG